MRGAARRPVLGWLALAPFCAALPLSSAAVAKAGALPAGFTLRRVLEREMAGGALLVVDRRWQCRKESAAEGPAVTGFQTACEVHAPPALAALAEIEKRRTVTGFLPLVLDSEGRIVGAPAGQAAELEAVMAAAVKAMAGAAGPGDKAFLAALGRTSAEAVSQVPADLFFPAPAPRRFSRDLALPEGGSGTLEVAFEARTDPASGLLLASTREVVTSAAGLRRRASESWSLSAI